MSTKEFWRPLLWPLVIFFTLVFNLWLTPLCYLFEMNSIAIAMAEWVSIAIFATDMVIHYRYPHLLPKNPMTNNSIFSPYQKSRRRFFDVIAIVPFISLTLIMAAPSVFFLFTLLRLLKLPPILKVFAIYDKTAHFPKALKVMLILFSIAVFIHLVTCTWLAITPDWAPLNATSYSKAMYWAVTTLTTTGYGDITPTTNIGRAFTMVIMITGIGCFGVVIGYISQVLFFADRHKSAVKEKIEDLTLFMQHYNIPPNLRHQIFGFYNHMLEQRLTDNDSALISELPTKLRNEMELYMNLRLIRNVPLFSSCEKECLHMIAKELEHIYFAPDEMVIRKDENGDEMFIIGHGQVDVCGPSGEIYATLGDHQFFGEMALLQKITRTADVKAKTYCDLYRLGKDQFLKVVERFPKLRENIEETLLRRRSADRDKKEIKTGEKKNAA